MKRIAAVFIVLLAIQILVSENLNSFPRISILKPGSQGGVLAFASSEVERFEKTSQNIDSLVLKNYSGLPLKALQFKLIVGTGGKLIFKSVERGSSIPASSFWFDYEIYKGKKQPDGSSIDTIVALFLGNGENVLLPGRLHHIISINYDIASVDIENTVTSLRLTNVIGATGTPVQDANITAGNDENIYLRKSSVYDAEINLLQNYPNPFNPNTTIKYKITEYEYVSLKIFNSLGEEITSLTAEYKTPGTYESSFDAGGLPSGVYLYRLQTSSYTETRKMLLIK